MIYERREFTVNAPPSTVQASIQSLHQPRERYISTRGVRLDVTVLPTEFGVTEFRMRRLPQRPLAIFNRGRVDGRLQQLSQTHTLVTLNIDCRLLALRAILTAIVVILSALMWGVLFASPVSAAIGILLGTVIGGGWHVYHYQRMIGILVTLFGSAMRQGDFDDHPVGTTQFSS